MMKLALPEVPGFHKFAHLLENWPENFHRFPLHFFTVFLYKSNILGSLKFLPFSLFSSGIGQLLARTSDHEGP